MRRAIERVILVPGLVILVSVIVGAAGAIAPADATAAPPTAGRPTAVGRVVTARSVVASAPRDFHPPTGEPEDHGDFRDDLLVRRGR